MCSPWEEAIEVERVAYPRKSWGENRARQRRDNEAKKKISLFRPEADRPPMPLREVFK